MDKKNKLYRKIKALLALAENNQNPNEAANAAQKAAALIQKYNLDAGEAHDWKEQPTIAHKTVFLSKYISDRVRQRGRKAWEHGHTEWFTSLASAVARICDAKVPYFSPGSVTIIGNQENVKQAAFLISNIFNRLMIMAETAVKQYAADYKAKHGESPYRRGGWVHPNRWREGWLEGAGTEIAIRLFKQAREAKEKRQKSARQANALVITNAAIEAYKDEHFSYVKGTFDPSHFHSTGFSDGMADGRKFALQEGLDGEQEIAVAALQRGAS